MRARTAQNPRTLSGRLFAVLFVLSFLVMLVSLFAATAASYREYESQAEDLLLEQTQALAQQLASEPAPGAMTATLEDTVLVDVRTTLVDADGDVLYDSQVDAAVLENHGTREEIEQARRTGQSIVVRHSETLGSDTVYAAATVRDGIVLRLAETRTSLPSFLAGMALPLAISLVVIVLLSLAASRILARMILRPLHQIDLAHPLDNDAYAELQPLLHRIDAQRGELETRNIELQEAVNVRREFTSNVSHEMKTPLQVIGGYAELMEAGVVSPDDVPHFAGLIREEAVQMRDLIDDVLVLSKLDERAVRADEDIDLAETCRRVAARLQATADERQVTVQMNLADGSLIKGERSLAEQMVYNLVDNAIKYNHEDGDVRISVQVRPGTVVLSVEDSGDGIPQAARARVFERFYRVDASRSRDTGGTGLGLAIVKHAAESFGGSVSVDDSPALGGARFTVVLPQVR